MKKTSTILDERTDKHPNHRSELADVQSVGQVLEKNTIIIENRALRQGFTQIPNHILRDTRLSFGARLAYAMLLSYAWQEGSCFPGQERLAQDLGVSRRSASAFLRELREADYVSWRRRGLGRTNLYRILDIEADVKLASHQDGKEPLHLIEKQASH